MPVKPSKNPEYDQEKTPVNSQNSPTIRRLQIPPRLSTFSARHLILPPSMPALRRCNSNRSSTLLKVTVGQSLSRSCQEAIRVVLARRKPPRQTLGRKSAVYLRRRMRPWALHWLVRCRISSPKCRKWASAPTEPRPASTIAL